LDAIAMQSRILAKKFEEENNGGRRISRLPAGAVANEFAKSRPDFFRAMTAGSHFLQIPQNAQEDDISAKNAVEVQTVHNTQRPVSHYPQMVLTDSIFGLGKTFSFQSQLNPVEESSSFEKQGQPPYSFPRSHSPEQIEHPAHNGINLSPPLPPATSSLPDMSPQQQLSIGPSLYSQSPPNSSQNLPPALTIRAVPAHLSNDGSSDAVDDALRSLSLERPNPPFQKEFSVLRSPSLNSERSVSSSVNRPSMNYSRPISRQSRPSMDSKTLGESPYQAQSARFSASRLPLDLVYRQDSADTNVSPFSNDAPHTPTSLASEDLFSSPEAISDSTPASYVYAKYALTSKNSKRESVGLEEFINKQFNWDSSQTDAQMAFTLPRPIVLSHSPPSPALTTSHMFGRNKDRPADIIIPGIARPLSEGSPAARRKLRKSQPGTPTTMISETSTLKGGILGSKPASIKELPPSEHLKRGIELHEEGNLQKSTYHLRLASKAGHPTAMLLYALACRHGWGIKPNAAEGVAWLQKAVDSAQLEVAEDEDLIKHGHSLDSTERKTHKAQFALSVYELGVSYMKGWGVTQDKSLGLRCFEIAGNWGDADALTEAGHCYMEGIGCKKDLKKSAKFYRQAELRGAQVAGNSW
jgi:hypothetical protein